jgi:protein-tyrosine kinase
MSRVDQALRRAAEDGTRLADGIEKSISGVMVAGDVAELSQEPFPLEANALPISAPELDEAPLRVPTATQPQRLANDEPHSDGSLFDHVDAQLAGKIVVDENTSPVSREQYRRLAAALHRSSELTGVRVVMITSAAVGEGKTLTAANLALTLSESYQKKVLLIDADLRRPAVQSVFRLHDGAGLGESLISTSGRKMPVHRVSPLLSVITAGRPTSDPISRLTSDRMRRLLDEARERFEWIIIDTPPVALLPDANLLSQMVDGAILVIRANGPSYQLVQRAVDAIGRDKIIGTVLNRATQTTAHGGDDHYYQYYHYSRAANAKPAGTVSS